MTVVNTILVAIADKDKIAMASARGLAQEPLEKGGASCLKPIWPILNLAISPIRFESPPLKLLESVMVFGSTVGGTLVSSC